MTRLPSIFAAAVVLILVASSSFAQTSPIIDAMKVTYMGVDVYTDGGSWNAIDGRLAQTDASAWLAGAMVPAGTSGITEYSFDMEYIDGLKDDALGIGAIVPGFLMGLVWDPEHLGGSGLRAQVYNDRGEIHEYNGITYDFEVPKSMIAAITEETLRTTPLTFRFRIDSTNGNVWLKNPFEQDSGWTFTLGRSLERFDNSMVGVGTTSLAASFGNFSSMPADSLAADGFSSAPILDTPFLINPSSGGIGIAPPAASERISKLLFAGELPEPTTQMAIDRSIFEQDGTESITWSHIDAAITSALPRARYKHRYIVSDSGFIISTIDEYKCATGEKVPRWLSFVKQTVGPGAKLLGLWGDDLDVPDEIVDGFVSEMTDVIGAGNLAKYHWLVAIKDVVFPLLLKSLEPGCYRIIWIVITDNEISFSDRHLDYEGLKILLKQLPSELPTDLHDTEYSHDHEARVLIYQYEVGDTPRFIESDDKQKIEARHHLMRSKAEGLLTAEQLLLN